VIAMLADATLRVESHDRRSQLCIHQEDFQPLSCVSVSQVLLELEVEFAERMQFKHTLELSVGSRFEASRKYNFDGGARRDLIVEVQRSLVDRLCGLGCNRDLFEATVPIPFPI
jgi:hypothetical protein